MVGAVLGCTITMLYYNISLPSAVGGCDLNHQFAELYLTISGVCVCVCVCQGGGGGGQWGGLYTESPVCSYLTISLYLH